MRPAVFSASIRVQGVSAVFPWRYHQCRLDPINYPTRFDALRWANSGTINVNSGASALYFSGPNGLWGQQPGVRHRRGRLADSLRRRAKTDLINQNAGALTLDGGLTILNSAFNFNGGTINGQNGVVYLINCGLNFAPSADTARCLHFDRIGQHAGRGHQGGAVGLDARRQRRRPHDHYPDQRLQQRRLAASGIGHCRLQQLSHGHERRPHQCSQRNIHH